MKPVDELITRATLDALEPKALEISMRASEEVEKQRRRAESLWQKRLQRARYDAERAERQYNAVEPENRLVARTLERSWEEALESERALQEEYKRHELRQPRYLTDEERQAIRSLATNLPALWNAPTTTPSDRKEVLRLLIEQVTVTIDNGSEWVAVGVKWSGGEETRTRLRRPVGKLSSLERHEELLEEIRRLRREGYTAPSIAEKLNEQGWVTPTQRNSFNARLVHAMLHRYGTVPVGPKRPLSDDPNEWGLTDLSERLRIPRPTLYTWLRRGWLKSRRIGGRYLVLADPEELERLRELRRQGTRGRRSMPPKSRSERKPSHEGP